MSRFAIWCIETESIEGAPTSFGWWSHFDGSPIVYSSRTEAELILLGLMLLFPNAEYEIRTYEE